VNSVIRNLLLNLKHENRQELLVDVLRTPSSQNSQDINIEFDEANDRYISFTYHEKGRPKEFERFHGREWFPAVYLPLRSYSFAPADIVLFDEPDAHLHGSLQDALLVEFEHLVDEAARSFSPRTRAR